MTGNPAAVLSGDSVERRLSVLGDFARVAVMVGSTIDFETLSDESVKLLAVLAEMNFEIAMGLLARDSAADCERENVVGPTAGGSPEGLSPLACERLALACESLYRLSLTTRPTSELAE
ncbi:hypothetical protein [Pseudofrankia asymbiotica]|uniref:Uncharacterized protein n=1 Tax=Pseudofrankia asymbiotica TaxID=1834516 RepID=A0A1V2IKW5_9ACTN|nr:hypothetical protein [Pseudofrankia asymbiotica]ONH33650.1 hypothetical protein BL253_01130 [Pseudofrankia asymbiotica]